MAAIISDVLTTSFEQYLSFLGFQTSVACLSHAQGLACIAVPCDHRRRARVASVAAAAKTALSAALATGDAATASSAAVSAAAVMSAALCSALEYPLPERNGERVSEILDVLGAPYRVCFVDVTSGATLLELRPEDEPLAAQPHATAALAAIAAAGPAALVNAEEVLVLLSTPAEQRARTAQLRATVTARGGRGGHGVGAPPLAMPWLSAPSVEHAADLLNHGSVKTSVGAGSGGSGSVFETPSRRGRHRRPSVAGELMADDAVYSPHSHHHGHGHSAHSHQRSRSDSKTRAAVTPRGHGDAISVPGSSAAVARPAPMTPLPAWFEKIRALLQPAYSYIPRHSVAFHGSYDSGPWFRAHVQTTHLSQAHALAAFARSPVPRTPLQLTPQPRIAASAYTSVSASGARHNTTSTTTAATTATSMRAVPSASVLGVHCAGATRAAAVPAAALEGVQALLLTVDEIDSGSDSDSGDDSESDDDDTTSELCKECADECVQDEPDWAHSPSHSQSLSDIQTRCAACTRRARRLRARARLQQRSGGTKKQEPFVVLWLGTYAGEVAAFAAGSLTGSSTSSIASFAQGLGMAPLDAPSAAERSLLAAFSTDAYEGESAAFDTAFDPLSEATPAEFDLDTADAVLLRRNCAPATTADWDGQSWDAELAAEAAADTADAALAFAVQTGDWSCFASTSVLN